MPATISQRITRALLRLAEDPQTSHDQKLSALTQLARMYGDKPKQKRKPRKAKQSTGSLLGD